MVSDSTGNLFFADQRTKSVRRIDKQTGIITTVAGGGNSIKDNVLATTFSFRLLSNIALDKNGDIFIVDEFRVIKKVNILTNIINPIFENILVFPRSIAINGNNLLVAELIRVFKVDPKTNLLTTFARGKDGVYSGDGGDISKASLSDCSRISITPNNQLLMINRDFLIQSIRLAKLPK